MKSFFTRRNTTIDTVRVHDDLLGAGDDTPGGGPAGKGGAHLFSHISALVSPATVSSLKAARL